MSQCLQSILALWSVRALVASFPGVAAQAARDWNPTINKEMNTWTKLLTFSLSQDPVLLGWECGESMRGRCISFQIEHTTLEPLASPKGLSTVAVQTHFQKAK